MPTGKPVDFHQAGKRHFSDAELLRTHARNAAAGQLYGFAAECGIKFLLIKQGYPTDPTTGELVDRHVKIHINKLVQTINTLLEGRNAAQYLANIPHFADFFDWATDHRYYLDSHIPPSLSKWQNASREVMLMLDQLLLDMP